MYYLYISLLYGNLWFMQLFCFPGFFLNLIFYYVLRRKRNTMFIEFQSGWDLYVIICYVRESR